MQKVQILLRMLWRFPVHTECMKIIHGSECKLSIYYDETFTPILYCTETLRSSDLVYSLDETVWDRKRVIDHKYGTEIAGCFVTRLTKDCIIPLFKIITDPGCAFTIYMDCVKKLQLKMYTKTISVT